jgi:hypothetical protein
MIFERKSPPLDYFVAEAAEWEEVCRAWCSLEPVVLMAQRQEFIDATQTTLTRKSTLKLSWTPETDRITTDCRAKLAKAIPVNEAEPNNIANYRIFEIDQIVNVKEQNRELELMVVEKT